LPFVVAVILAVTSYYLPSASRALFHVADQLNMILADQYSTIMTGAKLALWKAVLLTPKDSIKRLAVYQINPNCLSCLDSCRPGMVHPTVVMEYLVLAHE